jgi:putative addiction module component (TIGR02574 family)
MSVDISSLRDLPVADKLRLVTLLWDDIAQSDSSQLLSADQIAEASRRAQELQLDPSIAIDDAELWRRVDG